jgi:SAM-dependent methyltransferase
MEILGDKIRKIITNMKKDEEFEVSYNIKKLIKEQDVINLKNHYIQVVQPEKNTTMDITIKDIRITLSGIDEINKLYSFAEGKNNKEIITYVLKQKNISMISKKIINNLSYYNKDKDIKYKLSHEKKISEKSVLKILESIKSTEDISLFFRYKNRLSFTFLKNEKIRIGLDITIAQENRNIKSVLGSTKHIEVELEIFKLERFQGISDGEIDVFLSNMTTIFDIISNKNEDGTDFSKIVEGYKRHMKISKNELFTINPVSLNSETYMKDIPFNYSVTDKCDGEKVHVFVSDQCIYILNNVLKVCVHGKNPNLPAKVDYIIEAEKSGGRILVFDILLYENTLLLNRKIGERYTYLDLFLTKLQTGKNFKFLKIIHFPTKIEKVLDSYKENMEKYIEFLKKNDNIIEKKYMIFNSGLYGREEIYKYADLIWKTFIRMPYLLDGIIFTNTLIPYIKKKGSIYKWKPDEYNSIDFYIKFKKNEKRQIEYVVKDEKKFIIIELYCYDENREKEHYLVPFKKNENLHLAFIEIKENGFAYDSNGEIISENTIIEMVYNKFMIDSESPFYWSVIRTRHDKTLYSRIHKKKFGNHISVAHKIFDIKLNPFDLLSPLSTEKSKETSFDDLYYEKKSNIGIYMRNFHNHIKNMIIMNYCQGKSVLDVGCGRGGDIIKFINAKTRFVVGIDVNYMDLFVLSDCAQNRYDQFLKSNKNIPEMIFINCDFKLPLSIEFQGKRSMTEKNIQNMQKYIESTMKYDVLNFSFSFHYFYEKTNQMKVIENNINSKLEKNGYVLLTIFDSKKVMAFLNGKSEESVSYINQNGKRETLFTIQLVNDHEINLHNSMYNLPGNFYKESLIKMEELVNFFKNINCELVESLLFEDYIETSRPLMNIIFESQEKKDEKEKKLDAFYNNFDSSEINATRELSKLYRFYIFRKYDV